MSFVSVAFNYYGDPVPKARPRVTSRGIYTPKTTQDFEAAVKKEAVAAAAHLNGPTDQPVRMRLRLYLRRAKSWTIRKQKLLMGRAHSQRPDLDNLVKSVVDACEGVIYVDDKQIYKMDVIKAWDADPTGPGLSCVFEWYESSESTPKLIP